jgi:hypothetical protein
MNKEQQLGSRRHFISSKIQNFSFPYETMSEIANLIRENGKDWWIDHHHGFGTGIRNLLREGGFEWDPIEMDDMWVGLVERAVGKKFRTKSSTPE